VEATRKRLPGSFLKSNIFLCYFLWMDVLIVKPINPLGKKPKRKLVFELQKLKLQLRQRKKHLDFQQ
jgi:hypothetical protein